MINVTLINLTGSQKIDGELSLDSGIIRHLSDKGVEYKHITSFAALGFSVIEKQVEPVKLKEVKKSTVKKV